MKVVAGVEQVVVRVHDVDPNADLPARHHCPALVRQQHQLQTHRQHNTQVGGGGLDHLTWGYILVHQLHNACSRLAAGGHLS